MSKRKIVLAALAFGAAAATAGALWLAQTYTSPEESFVGKLTVELGTESKPICDCCGSLSHVLRGTVRDDRGVYAAYVAGYTEKNPNHFGTLLISLGVWGEGSTPSQRKSILVLVKNVEGKPSFMLGSAADCRWNDVQVMGRIMDRQEALADPRIKDYWHLSDHIWMTDRRFSDYFESQGQ